MSEHFSKTLGGIFQKPGWTPNPGWNFPQPWVEFSSSSPEKSSEFWNGLYRCLLFVFAMYNQFHNYLPFLPFTCIVGTEGNNKTGCRFSISEEDKDELYHIVEQALQRYSGPKVQLTKGTVGQRYS